MILNHLPQPITHEEILSNTFPAALCLAARKASLPNWALGWDLSMNVPSQQHTVLLLLSD